MFFYTTLSGWTIAYMVKFASGQLAGMNAEQIGGAFGAFLGNPGEQLLWLFVVVLSGFAVAAGGLMKSVEPVIKYIMLSLFAILIILAIRSLMLDGAAEGIAFLFRPNPAAIAEHGFWKIAYGALGQAFFSLSIGIGSMTIFGSYIKKERKLYSESLLVGTLDLSVSLLAGIIVFACCFTFGVTPGAGPGLVFVSLPNIFNVMAGGRFWGSLFFLFFAFASWTTVVAVFENIIAFAMDATGCSRKKACAINFFVVLICAIPCALGFNILAGPLTPALSWLGDGAVVLDLEDFFVSQLLLPIGAFIYLMFCVSKKGWGWDNFIAEVNTGKGLNFPQALKAFYVWIVPFVVLAIFILGLLNFFGVVSI
jgi:NSS family neurotransmitter:Na+ symporter